MANPDLWKYAKPFGTPGGADPRECAYKSHEAHRQNVAALKNFIELDAEDPDTPEDRKTIIKNVRRRAKFSDKALEVYRDTVGLKPADQLDINKMDINIRIELTDD